MDHEVFLSCAEENRDVAEAVCEKLESRGIACWMAPRDVLPGEPWRRSIVDAIQRSRAMVVILSSHSNSSPHVAREVATADDHQLEVIPFRIEPVAPEGELAYLLRSTQWLDALTPDLEEHLQTLYEVMAARLQCARAAVAPPAGAAPPVRRRTAVEKALRRAPLRWLAVAPVALLLAAAAWWLLRGAEATDSGLSPLLRASDLRPQDDRAAERYRAGVERLARFNARAAVQALEDAAEIEDGFALTHIALADAWDRLGQGQKALAEAEKACRPDSVGVFPGRTRLLVEAHCQRLARDYDQAITTYGKIRGRSLEEDLALAEAQIEGGYGDQALATLARWNEADEPRVHLLAARAHDGRGRPGEQLERANRALELAEQKDLPHVVARALLLRGIAHFGRGHVELALQDFEHAEALAGDISDDRTVGEARNAAGNALSWLGRIGEAEQEFEGARRAYEKAGDAPRAALQLRNAASFAALRGDLAGAGRRQREALEAIRELGDPEAEARIHHDIGLRLLWRGDLAGAAIHLRQAGELFGVDDAGRAEVLSAQGDLEAARGRLDRAHAANRDAINLREALGRGGAATAPNRKALAYVALEGGSPEDALPLLQGAIADFQAAGDPQSEAEARALLARVHLTLGDLGLARGELDAAAGKGRGSEVFATRLTLDLAEACVLAAEGRAGEARALLERVRASAAEAKHYLLWSEARLTLGEVMLAAGDTERGRRLLGAVAASARRWGFGLTAEKAERLIRGERRAAGLLACCGPAKPAPVTRLGGEPDGQSGPR